MSTMETQDKGLLVEWQECMARATALGLSQEEAARIIGKNFARLVVQKKGR